MNDELLTISQISKQLDLAENTARRYVKQFRDFLPVHQTGRITKYGPAALQIVAQIADMYKEGLNTPDIEKRLKRVHTRVIDVQTEMPQTVVPGLTDIAEQLARQQQLMEAMLAKMDQQQTYIEESIRKRDEQLMNALRGLLESKKQLATSEQENKRQWWKLW